MGLHEPSAAKGSQVGIATQCFPNGSAGRHQEVITKDANDPCWLCRVRDGTAKASVVAQSDEVLVLIAPLALNPGHTLVIPRQHIRDLYELPDELAGPILSTAARVARAAKRAFSADGVALRQHNEPAGGQEVFHFHLHVVPRFTGDDSRFNSAPKLITRELQESLAAELRVVLGAG